MLLLLNICIHCANKAGSDFKDQNKIDRCVDVNEVSAPLRVPVAPREARAGGKRTLCACFRLPTTEAWCTNNFAKKNLFAKLLLKYNLNYKRENTKRISQKSNSYLLMALVTTSQKPR